MKVEKTDNEILVRISADMKKERLQDILDYLRYEELTSKSTASEEDLNELLKEAKKGRWSKIKSEIGLDEKNNS